MNCSEGYSSDSIFRLPIPWSAAVGFDVPLGHDCFLNRRVYNPLVLTLVLCAAVAVVVTMLRVARRKVRGLSLLLYVYLGSTAVLVSLAFCTVYNPSRARWLWNLWILSIAGMVHVTLYHLTGAQVKLTGNLLHVSSDEVLKRMWMRTPASVGLLLGYVLMVVGSLCATVYVDQSQIESALVAWDVHCAGWVIGGGCAVLCYRSCIMACVETIKDTALKAHRAGGGGNSDREKEAIARMVKSANMITGTFPLLVIIWTVHIAILPMFAYIFIVHAVVTQLVAVVVLQLFLVGRPKEDRLSRRTPPVSDNKD